MVTVKFSRAGATITDSDAARKARIETIFRHYAANVSAPETVRVALDAIQIRGGLEKTSYTGYDYAAQQWVEVTF